MKHKISKVAAAMLLTASLPVSAEMCSSFNPYVGADAEFRHMNFQKDFGGNLVKHSLPQGNLYVGIRLNEYLAVEAGYEATKKKSRINTLQANDVAFGFLIPPVGGVTFNTTAKFKALHANLVGTLPICDLYRLQFIGMVGVAHLKTNIVRTTLAVNGIAAANPNPVTFANSKNVLRLGAGIQHMINCNWGVRAMLKWENSSKIKQTVQSGRTLLSLKAKDNMIYSVGAFFNF